MKSLKRNKIGIDQGTRVLFSDFEDGGVMWTGNGIRKSYTKIEYQDTFAECPIVQVSLSMWDLDQKTSPRADISATDITEKGFSILFQTWGDTRVARVRADWFAIGELADDDEWEVD